MWICGKCGIEFEPRKTQLRQRNRICNPCGSARNAAYVKKRRLNGNPIKSNEAKKASNLRQRQLPENRKRAAEQAARKRADPANRAKIVATAALRQKIRSGKMQRLPCEVCGEPQTHAHHHDYSKPFDVSWLCKLHHAEIHAAERLRRDQEVHRALQPH